MKNRDFLFLDNSSSQTVLNVLSDISNCINCNWILSGSISYRLQIPHIKTQSGLRDIDIAIYPKPGQNPKLLVSKEIHKYFYVVNITEIGRGYYFRLIHKTTKTHVDVFTPSHTPEHNSIELGNMRVDVEAPEETLFAIFRHLLHRESNGMIIRQKMLSNAKNLWNVVNQKKVHSMFTEFRDEYYSSLPDSLKADDTNHIIAHILSLQTDSTRYRGKNYPIDCVTTLNGITIENEKTYRQLLGQKSLLSRIQRRLKKWKNSFFFITISNPRFPKN